MQNAMSEEATAFKEEAVSEELVDTLIAISVVSKKLAKKLEKEMEA